ncbi:hypothetical protein [Clostridium sp. D46t1_190503_E9]|uniref:hypothetical protein n=1 Tax=Clostridium sp. D46t1_190503_E9 TaxID=2787137 RepID=UPI00189B998C|nr:hypothetical protein [Clostridium sp. D46t1_190503_E9]
MYCVIQEIGLKKENTYGEYKELEAYYTSSATYGVDVGYYEYRYTGGRFKRPIKKAYKISIHKSYREAGKVKKKQWSICTIEYYDIATDSDMWIGDYCDLNKKIEAIGVTEEELCKMVYNKLNSLVERIEREYKKTKEYEIHKKHEKIINKYIKDKTNFEEKYGRYSYDKCYDVFGVLRNNEMLDNIKKQYEESKEQQRSYYENFKSNYNSYNSSSSYQKNKHSNYSEEDRDKYKKIYKTLVKVYHPDIAKDDGEMMKVVNKLKVEWGI